MRRALSSELLKLRTTRTFYALMLSALLLTAGLSVLAAAVGSWGPRATVAPGEDLVGFAFFGLAFAFVLGLLAVTTEFRHGTITPTLQAVPGRSRLVAAKLVTHLLAGLVLGLLAVALNLVLVEAVLSLRDISSGTSSGDVVRWELGLAIAGALFAALGVGIGAIVRNQVAALVGGFAWLFVVEPLLGAIPHVGHTVTRFGLGGLSDALDGFNGHGDDLLGRLPAGLVLAAYVALFAAVGAALLRRRDVTT
jgi:ABC-2 type transport system permease protein